MCVFSVCAGLSNARLAWPCSAETTCKKLRVFFFVCLMLAFPFRPSEPHLNKRRASLRAQGHAKRSMYFFSPKTVFMVMSVHASRGNRKVNKPRCFQKRHSRDRRFDQPRWRRTAIAQKSKKTKKRQNNRRVRDFFRDSGRDLFF